MRIRNEDPERGSGTRIRNEDPERGSGTRIQNEDPERGTRIWDGVLDTLQPCVNSVITLGNEDPPCVHMGGRVTLFLCIIRSKCIGNDVVCYRKPRDVLISQSNVCSSLVRPIKGHVWGLGSQNDNTSLTSSLGERKMELGTIQGAC